MTPEKEIELCENVATIAANIDNLGRTLDAHTLADSSNFLEMKESIGKVQIQIDPLLKDKLDAVIIQLAEQRGAQKNRAIMWSLISSGGLLSAFEFARAIWFK